MTRPTTELFDRDRTRWLRLATVLTGEPAAARTLLAAAILRRPRRTDRVKGSDAALDDSEDAELRADDTARQVLLDAYLGRRLGWAAPLPDPTPDEDSPPTPVEPRWTELTRRQRAAVALVCFEELTETEAARVLEESQPVVHADLAAALGKLEFPAGQPGFERAGQLLRAVADRAPGTQGFGGEVRRQQAAQRRFRGRILAVATAVLLVVVGVTVVPEFVRHRLPVTAREPGELVHQHQIEPPPGWRVADRGVGNDVDHTYLSGHEESGQGLNGDSKFCVVSTWARGVEPKGTSTDTQSAGEAVRIHGDPGRITTVDEGRTSVTWEFAPDAQAEVMCSKDLQAEQVVQLARTALFRQSAIMVPFRLPEATSEFGIQSVSQHGTAVSVMGELGDSSGPVTEEPTVLHVTLDPEVPSPEEEPGGDGLVDNPAGGTCRVQGALSLCGYISTPARRDHPGSSQADHYERREKDLETTRILLADLELADLADRETWFDARDAFSS
ncbi:MAG: hypothetical protein ACTH2Q_10880 [Propionibacteriaceae bacterium]